ncbi:hypothetical protein ACH5RR_038664 [Cinchona calisaya]|uniref:Uncharacterized protein n=1 Tax=Cinchona calisaya TaxID=153742 RepID=A0ABD2XYG7_9GENT
MATTLLTRFLRRTPTSTSAAAAHLIFPSFSFSFSTFTQDSDYKPTRTIKLDSYNEEQPKKLLQIAHPLQTGGPEEVAITRHSPIGFHLRLCMPGVAKDGFKTWVENNTVFYKGFGEIEDESETSGRNYGGNIELDPRFFKVTGIQSWMKHGILWVLVLGQYNPETHN